MKIDTQKIVKHLINKMFEYAHVPQTYDDIIHRKDEWYQEYTMTQEQSNSFKKIIRSFNNLEYIS